MKGIMYVCYPQIVVYDADYYICMTCTLALHTAIRQTISMRAVWSEPMYDAHIDPCVHIPRMVPCHACTCTDTVMYITRAMYFVNVR